MSHRSLDGKYRTPTTEHTDPGVPGKQTLEGKFGDLCGDPFLAFMQRPSVDVCGEASELEHVLQSEQSRMEATED